MKKINFSQLFLVLLISILFTACYQQKDGDNSNSSKIVGIGELVEQTIPLSDFSKLELTGAASINIAKGTSQLVKITAQQNILDILKHQVVNGSLVIGYDEKTSVETSKGIMVDITTPNAITNVSITGAGRLNISGNKQDVFSAVITGAGEINAYDLEVGTFSINISGAGSCKTKVTNKLNVVIAGTGSVVYKGNPTVNKSIAGIGVVINGN
jgi:hypothetical protein